MNNYTPTSRTKLKRLHKRTVYDKTLVGWLRARPLCVSVVAGRWAEVRAPSELEMRQTAVLALPLEEVSAKVRVGPPVDDEEDYALPVWAGVVPIRTTLGEPIADARIASGVAPPEPSQFASRAGRASAGRA